MDLVSHLTDRLLFAVPKKGRLHESCLTLLQGSDIQFHRHSRLDIALCLNLPIALVFLPAADIPRFVGEGRCDVGITGRDQVFESGLQEEVVELLDLGFGRCKLQVQVPENGDITEAGQLVGRKVVSSFTRLAGEYFKGLGGGREMEVKYVSGSVEAACALGIADGIVDLVESGETMKAAKLKPIATILETTAVLIKSKNPTNPKLVETIESRIRGVITAKKYVLVTYNVARSNLNAVKIITPGKRAPTIMQLEEEGWVAVSTMVEKKNVANVMDALEETGATDILVTQLSNTRCAKE